MGREVLIFPPFEGQDFSVGSGSSVMKVICWLCWEECQAVAFPPALCGRTLIIALCLYVAFLVACRVGVDSDCEAVLFASFASSQSQKPGCGETGKD